MQITTTLLDRLTPWFGYGNFREAQVIFFGNEEGLSGRADRLELMLKARAELLGNDPQNWINDNRESGCWESSGRDADKKLVAYINKLTGEQEEWVPFTKSPMLQYQARLLLALEEPNQDWFVSGESEVFEIVKKYVADCLYTDKAKIKSGLVDLRTLPRANEKEWPFSLNESEYKRAFTYNRNSSKSSLFELAEKRANVLKTVFESFPSPVIIGIGDRYAKMNFFKRYIVDKFGKKPIFYKAKLSTCEIFVSDIEFNNRVVKVLLCPFFDHYGHGHLKLQGLKELTTEYVKPFLYKD